MPLILQLKQQKHAIVREYAKASNLIALFEVLTTLIPIGLLWLAAVWSAGVSAWLTALVIGLLTLFTIRVLVLMHDCGHGSLFGSQRLNRAFGFIFGVVCGMPQYVWSQSHSYHHATNGDWEKFRGPLTTPSVAEYAAMSVKQQRTYRYARNIFLAPLGGFVYLIFNPRYSWLRGSIEMLVHVAQQKRENPALGVRQLAAAYRSRRWKSSREYRAMLWNNLALLGMWALMCWLVGPRLFFMVYLISVSLAGGVGIALFTVQHNFEHSHATDSAHWDYDVGAMKGTSFLTLPRWLNWFTANIGYHHVHHISSRIPCYRLVACHEANEDLFAEIQRIKLREVPRSLQCLLWDASAQRIISFAEYRSLYGSLS